MKKIFTLLILFVIQFNSAFALVTQVVYDETKCGLNYIYRSAKTTSRYTSPPSVARPVVFNINELPQCWEIEKAYVWWGISYENGSQPNPTITFTNSQGNTTTLAATRIGEGPNKCWSEIGTRSFRAEVTNLITGNGNYQIELESNLRETDGLLFMIVYRDRQATYQGYLRLQDGLYTNSGGGPSTHSLPNLNFCDNSISGSAFILLSDIQDNITGTNGEFSLDFNGTNQARSRDFWNFEVFNTNFAANQTDYSITVDPGGDCYSAIVSGVYSQTTNCFNCPITLNVTASTDKNEICIGDDVQLAANGGVIYSWTSIPAGFTSNISNPLVSPTQTTRYIVRGSSQDGCLFGLDTVTVTVNPLPLLNLGNDVIICEGDAVTIGAIAQSGTPPFTYTWTPNTGLSNPNIATPIATPTQTTNYTCRVVDSKGCEDTDQITIFVNPLPQPVIIPDGPTSFCSCDSVILEVSNEFESYIWTTGETTRSITVRSSGNYNVTVTDTNGCINTAQPISVNVIQPTATISLPTQVQSVQAGQLANIPLFIAQSTNLDTCNVFNYTAVISYNRSILVPKSNTPIGQIIANRRVITLNGNRIKGDSILFNMEFMATLGDTANTDLTIESFQWNDCPFNVNLNSSTFNLDGLCTEGGITRLYRQSQQPAISIIPNPVKDNAEIEFSVYENTHVRLMLFDLLGRELLTLLDSEVHEGLHSISFNTANLQTGTYILFMNTNYNSSKIIMELVR